MMSLWTRIWKITMTRNEANPIMTPKSTDSETDAERTPEELRDQLEERREESTQSKEAAFGLNDDEDSEDDEDDNLHPRVARHDTIAGVDEP